MDDGVFEDLIAADEPESDGEESLEVILRSEVQDAVSYNDTELSPARAKAMEYYLGLPFGDEEQGRSQVVVTETRDKIMAMLPGILRVFTSGEKVVEYAPKGPEDVRHADLATPYVNYVIDADGNSYFTTLYSGVKDALLKRTGVLKWWWEKRTEVEEAQYEGITQLEVQKLSLDPEIEIISQEEVPPSPEVQQAMAFAEQSQDAVDQAMYLAASEPTYNLTIKRTRNKGYLRHAAIPPEQFIYSRNATSLDDGTLVGERRYETVSSLIAMGFDPELVRSKAGNEGELSFNAEALLRLPQQMDRIYNAEDESQKSVYFVDVLMRVDADGDGVAELRHIQAIGDELEIVTNEPAPEVNYAVLCPNPEPHSIGGLSVADDTMETQRIKSSIMRATLDSLSDSIFPTTVILDGAVEVDDVLNTERGRIIREKVQGAVRTLVEPFNGQAALGVVDYIDKLSASRTGITPASQGLDPDIMQSTTKAAVNATINASQDRLEMIIRIFAETGIKRFFRGILRTLVRYQDKPRMVRVLGDWVAVDPRYWNADMDVQVNVALGRGDEEMKLQFLMQVAAKQEQIIQTLGPDNILCDVSQLRTTYGEISRISGYKDVSRFFKEVTPEAMEQMAKQSAQQKPQDPATILAEVEKQKILADIEINKQKAQLEFAKATAEDDRERDKMMIDMYLKAAEITAKYGAQVDMASINAEVARERDAQKIVADQASTMHRNEMQANAQVQTAAMKPQMPPQGPQGVQ
jgi:hypothetical protein